MMELWHCADARSFRPLWMLEEMQLPYRLHMLPFPPRWAQPDYLQVNPLGTPYVFAHLEGGMGPDGLNVDARGNVYAAHYFAGRVRVFTSFGEPYGSIRLPEGAGRQTTNVTFRDGHLYITEAGKGEVWRVKTAFPGTAP